MVGDGAPLAEAAPFGFLIYFRNTVGPVLEQAGHTSQCTADLMGNHVIAERMFCFESFGITEVGQVGIELDHKLAALMEALAIPVTDALR